MRFSLFVMGKYVHQHLRMCVYVCVSCLNKNVFIFHSVLKYRIIIYRGPIIRKTLISIVVTNEAGIKPIMLCLLKYCNSCFYYSVTLATLMTSLSPKPCCISQQSSNN